MWTPWACVDNKCDPPPKLTTGGLWAETFTPSPPWSDPPGTQVLTHHGQCGEGATGKGCAPPNVMGNPEARELGLDFGICRASALSHPEC